MRSRLTGGYGFRVRACSTSRNDGTSNSALAARCARVAIATTQKSERIKAGVCAPPTRGSGAPKGASSNVRRSPAGVAACDPLRQRAVPAARPSSRARRRRVARQTAARSPFGVHAAALATGCDPDGSAPDPCFLGRGLCGSFARREPVPVQRAPRGPVLVPDDGAPEPPGSGVQIRARAPLPLRLFRSASREAPSTSGMRERVTETGTIVNEKETQPECQCRASLCLVARSPKLSDRPVTRSRLRRIRRCSLPPAPWLRGP